MHNSTEKRTILLVDDIVDNIQLLRSILSPLYRLKIATSGEKALALSQCDDPPDLILLDVMMPGIDGYEVCRRLKQHEKTRSIPVIFVTALEDATDEERGFAVGAIDYITKPVNPAIVKARVATHLALRRALTELEMQNSILSENVRLREQVERIMRHDLKSPLTAFIGIPTLLKLRKDLPEDVLESVSMLERSGKKMLDMINKSMDLYKIEAGTYRIRPVPVDLIKVVTQIEFEFSELAGVRAVSLQNFINGDEACENDSFFIKGEETLCYSMLANLIKNAVEACPSQGAIKVSFYERPCARIMINNPGMIPTAIRDRFMQKFVSQGKVGGTGLGGYSARMMAEVMGGTVGYTSDEVTGTTITIDFAGNSSTVLPKEESFGDIKVLLVEDNEFLAYTIREILRSIGLHQIETCLDITSALSYLNDTHEIRLIILDQDHDSEGARDFLTFVGDDERYRQVSLLLLTTEKSSNHELAEKSGETLFLIKKPFSPDILLKRVESIVEQMLKINERE